jgi:hypothetical protein
MRLHRPLGFAMVELSLMPAICQLRCCCRLLEAQMCPLAR